MCFVLCCVVSCAALCGVLFCSLRCCSFKCGVLFSLVTTQRRATQYQHKTTHSTAQCNATEHNTPHHIASQHRIMQRNTTHTQRSSCSSSLCVVLLYPTSLSVLLRTPRMMHDDTQHSQGFFLIDLSSGEVRSEMVGGGGAPPPPPKGGINDLCGYSIK